MTDPIRTDQPLDPIPHTDRAFFAPCLQRRRTANQAGRLTDEQVLEIRHRYEHEPISQQALADAYGVRRLTIGAIVRYLAHRDVTERVAA